VKKRILKKEKVRSLKKVRDTSKVILYDSYGRVCCFLCWNENGIWNKANFPGGGRNHRERFWQALKREVEEETNVTLTNAQAQNAIVLRRGKVPTTRPNLDFKELVMSTIHIKDVTSIVATEENVRPVIFNSSGEAIKWMMSEEVVLDVKVRAFYVSALRKLAKIIG